MIFTYVLINRLKIKYSQNDILRKSTQRFLLKQNCEFWDKKNSAPNDGGYLVKDLKDGS